MTPSSLSWAPWLSMGLVSTRGGWLPCVATAGSRHHKAWQPSSCQHCPGAAPFPALCVKGEEVPLAACPHTPTHG